MEHHTNLFQYKLSVANDIYPKQVHTINTVAHNYVLAEDCQIILALELLSEPVAQSEPAVAILPVAIVRAHILSQNEELFSLQTSDCHWYVERKQSHVWRASRCCSATMKNHPQPKDM
jgi:hypothetical protein